MTNSVCEEQTGRAPMYELENIKLLLNKFECSLIVFGYDMRPTSEVKKLASICKSTLEGRYLPDPDET